MDKVLRDKITNLVLWFVPLALLLFCFYEFALKSSIWLLIASCVATMFLGWMLRTYFND